MNFKIILFDAAGVLFPVNKVVGVALEQKFNLSEEALDPMWSGIYRQLSRGTLTTDEFLDTFAGNYHIPRSDVTRQDFVAVFEEALTPMPGMNDLLTRLSERDVTLAILSDTVEMFASAREKLGYFKYFDRQFLSFQTGYSKPNPLAYQAVIDYYKIKPGEIYFIDDKPANLEAAEKLGMSGIVFTNTQLLSEALENLNIL
jgi:putative hydrolase of the HAD superfamily